MNTIAIPKNRITSIDFLRGTIMIIMALDHVRDYFHYPAFFYDPTDLSKTSTAIFFTRWITHFCAPIFTFLAGTSAFLIGQKKSKGDLAQFLLLRGVWLILFEQVVMNFGWHFDITLSTVILIVLWGLGVGMIVLAGLIYLPTKFILLIGLILVGAHNLLDHIHVQGNTLQAFGWAIVHDPNFFSWHGENIFVGYPIISLVGIMALGYCLGEWYKKDFDPERRRKLLLYTGFGAIFLFIIIRFINVYGDPHPWSVQKSSMFTFLSFLNTTKYPVSLLYTLMTLGPALLFLGFTENSTGKIVDVVSVYGRVPLFYYVLHVYVLHLLTMIISGFTPFGWRMWIVNQPLWFDHDFQGYGFSLPIVYLIWISVVVALYPLCKWYDQYKQRNKQKWWLSYL
ncbi:MAG: hypothetical protein C5B52_14635 [Bacteroidetes bacterium]|nr:MAG: hypothetical protein C5B52_14635 [Bacteroidota bacterium]